ncbi:MAG: nucleoid-associated protein YgaU [Myxococcota bacterium]|jgi:nucleoid-associated protein YgaU
MGHLEKRIIIGALGLVAVLLTVVIFKGLNNGEEEVLFIPLEPVSKTVPIDEQGWPVDDRKPLQMDDNMGGEKGTALPVIPDPKKKPFVEPVVAKKGVFSPDTEKTIYKIMSGDTLGAIAQKQLGSTRYTKDIIELNPGTIASNLVIGDTLVLPAKASLKEKLIAKEAVVGNDARVHVVESGDSLTVIANKFYPGKYEYIEKIAAANKTLLTNGKNTVLRIGWKLNLPE